MREWSAEVAVDGPSARRLIAGQFPDLELRSMRLLAEGWDNAVWLVDERWVFRFPRRSIAIPGVEREMAVLPRLAPLLTLPVPVPVFHGRPADGYPWPFFGSAFLPGREAPDAVLTHAQRNRLAVPLAAFLRTLHSDAVANAVPAAHKLPADPMRRADMPFRVPQTIERLAEAEQLGLWRRRGSVMGVLEDAQTLTTTPPATGIAHGDLHFRHLLVDENAGLAGVIDWGDLCRADPAIDLPLLWSLLPPEGRTTFLAAYGPVSDEQLLRARVLAIFLCATLAVYAHHEGLPNVEREAVTGLTLASED